jgi:dihydrolipoamide dehydrogenase
VVPSCIFTTPEVAAVGLTTQEAEGRGIPFQTGRFPFAASGKAQTMSEGEGFVKVVASPQDRLLGVHIMGPAATELIAEAALAIKMGLSIHDLASTIHAHPTLAETLMEASEAVHGRSIHAG